MLRIFSFAVVLCAASVVCADTFYVAMDGEDAADRNGRSPEFAWRNLAYACEKIPAGDHVIQIGAGDFGAHRTAHLKSGWTVQGTPGKTTLVASDNWKFSEKPSQGDPTGEYLITAIKCKNIVVGNLALTSQPKHRITGGLFCRGCENVEAKMLNVREFRWAGVVFEHSSHVNLHHCLLHNASTEKDRYHNGLIQARWLKHSEIHHNRITSDIGGGYGYKGGGHEKVRMHHNYFEVAGGFAIESAHENEYGVEIDHNYANRCISIPKGGQGADPNLRDCAFTFDIHHNLLTDSYTVEGPRNHLRLHHNYIRIAKTGGRVYTHHGGINHGPIYIDHNIVENVDRAFVWMNNGLAENLYIFNNTVFCADAGERSSAIFGAYTGERLNNWRIVNNIFLAPSEKPRAIHPTQRGVPDKLALANNAFRNITEVEKSKSEANVGLAEKGEKPIPFFAPGDEGAIREGLNLDVPFEITTKHIGAVQSAADWKWLKEIPTSDSK